MILEESEKLLSKAGMKFDRNEDATVGLIDDGKLIATGSRKGNVLKCVAVDSERRGENIAGRIISSLITNAFSQGFTHLFLFTRLKNKKIFTSLGFYPVACTDNIILLENIHNGIDHFVRSLDVPHIKGKAGCIVAHCNPFTKGHLFLAETASHACDIVHFFVLSENNGMFTPDERMAFAKAALGRFPNVLVHPTGPYLISYVTFPDYFLKRNGKEANCLLDLTVFAEKFAKPLGITERFIGTEPSVPIMSQYNAAMKKYLPQKGIHITEIPRLQIKGHPVSASKVRCLIKNGQMEKARELIPQEVFRILPSWCFKVSN